MDALAGSGVRQYEVEVTDKGDPEFGKRVSRTRRFTFSTLAGAAKIVVDDEDRMGMWRRKIYGSNPEYVFIAGQSTPAGGFFIRECGRDRKTIDEVKFEIQFLVLSALHSAYGIESDLRSLPEILNSDGFELVSCNELKESGADLVQANVKFKPTGVAATQDPSTREASVVLDPKADWHVVRSVTKSATGDSTLFVTYAPDASNQARVKTLVRRTVGPKSVITVRTDYTYAEPPATADEFYLRALGLPDCPMAGGARIPRLAIIGLNFLVIGAILGWLYRRKRRTAAA